MLLDPVRRRYGNMLISNALKRNIMHPVSKFFTALLVTLGFFVIWDRAEIASFRSNSYVQSGLKAKDDLQLALTDFSEAHDLSAKYPDRVRALQSLFDSEAMKNDVYPIGGALSAGAPSLIGARKHFVYYPGPTRIPEAVVPNLSRVSYSLSAEVQGPESGLQGLIAEYGDRSNGVALYVQGGRLVFENHTGLTREVLRSGTPVPGGHVLLGVVFLLDPQQPPDASDVGMAGTVQILINNQLAGSVHLAHVVANGSLRIGRSSGSPVWRNSFPLEYANTGRRSRNAASAWSRNHVGVSMMWASASWTTRPCE